MSNSSIYFYNFIFSALIAIGRNLPFDIYPMGLTVVDLSVVIWVLLQLKNGAVYQYDYVAKCMSIVIVFNIFSISYNHFLYGLHWKDVFEVARYVVLIAMYYMLLQKITYLSAAIYGFTYGNLFVFIVAFLNPMNPDVVGFPQIFNPNVIGNVLSVNAMLLLYYYAIKPKTMSLILAACIFIATLFTYSKGSWLMTIITMSCFTLLILLFSRRKSNFNGLLVSILLLGGLIFAVTNNWNMISNLVESKIAATDFTATAVEGGSFSARMGLAYSGLIQWTLNPILGVGISNFELLNDKLSGQLAHWYYPDDNPNNVFIYILGGSGIFAFTGWMAMIVLFFKKYKRSLQTYSNSELVDFVVVSNAAIVILITGFTQNEMLNGFYFWFILALVKLIDDRRIKVD